LSFNNENVGCFALKFALYEGPLFEIPLPGETFLWIWTLTFKYCWFHGSWIKDAEIQFDKIINLVQLRMSTWNIYHEL
jgi:hypothetical protein